MNTILGVFEHSLDSQVGYFLTKSSPVVALINCSIARLGKELG